MPQPGEARLSTKVMNEQSIRGDLGSSTELTGFKRKRTAHACHSCRQRKSRCNGARPTCDVCLGMGFVCSYQELARYSTRVEPVDHISRLEARLHDMEQLLQTAVTGNLKVNPISPDSQICEESRNVPGINRVPGGSMEGFDAREAIARPDINFYLSKVAKDSVDGMASITFADETASGWFGPTSNSAFLSHITRALKDLTGLTGDNVPAWGLDNTAAVETNAISRPNSPQLPSVIEWPLELTVDDFVLPPHQEVLRLVDEFFANTGLLFPYLHKSTLLSNLSTMRTSDLKKVEQSQLCLLNMVMAFAAVYCSSETPADEKVAQGDVFLRRALAFLPDFRTRAANFESIQALVMVVQYVQGTQRAAQTWSLLGAVIHAAFQFGLYRQTCSDKLSALEAEVQKRTWWMCFMMDRMCSMTYGRPPLVPNSYMRVDLPLDTNVEMLENLDWTPDIFTHPRCSNSSLFLHTSKLNKILGSVIEEVYEQNIYDRSTLPISNLLQEILKIEQSLEKWKQELPLTLSLVSSLYLDDVLASKGSISERFRVVLTLRYLNTRTLLHRAVVSQLLDPEARKGSDDSTDLIHNFGVSNLDICVECAVESINIISCMARNQKFLPVWWWSIYFTFSSTLVAFGTILALQKHNMQLRSYTIPDLIESMRAAYKALKDLGGATRLVARCQKIVQRLIHTAVWLLQGQANSRIDQFSKPVFPPRIGSNLPNTDRRQDRISQDVLLAAVDDEMLASFNVDFSFGNPSMEDDLSLVFEHGF